MAILLGVDTGGTYTDAVLVRDEREVIASAKALTTRQDLSIGIGDAIEAVLAQSGVTPDQIRTWNGLSRSRHIYPGNRLVIYLPNGPAESRAGPLGKTPPVETSTRSSPATRSGRSHGSTGPASRTSRNGTASGSHLA